MPSKLAENEIKRHLKAELIGRKLYVFDEIDSTNNFARQINESGAAVIAGKQSRGRGRFSRRWESPEGGIYMSIVIFEEHEKEQSSLPRYAIFLPLACCNFLRKLGINASIKWPNDIVVSERKIGGILIEAESFEEKMKLIAGIGINANASISVDIPTTCIKEELGREVELNKAIADLLNEIEKYYKKSKRENAEELVEEYKNLCSTLGRAVIVRTVNETLSGIAEDISVNGELLLRMHNNELRKIISGECLHLYANNFNK